MTGGRGEGGELDDARIVGDALRAFAKAWRAVQLHLPNNPTRAHAIEQARFAFAAMWAVADPCELRIGESSLRWNDRVVYEDPERGTDGLPWILYRDGLRSLQLRSAFEHADLETLLHLLHKVRVGSADDDDLVTLLWIADLTHVTYRHVETDGLADLPMLSRDGGAGRDSRNTGQSATEAEFDAGRDDPPPTTVRVEDFESTLYFLDPPEITYLQAELALEYGDDHRLRVLRMLGDVVHAQTHVAVSQEIVPLFEQLLVEWLALGDVDLAAEVAREAGVLAASPHLDDSVRAALRAVTARLSEPAVMGQLLQMLEESPRPVADAALDALFRTLLPSALAPMLAWLAVTSTSRARASVERASLRIAGEHTAVFVALLDTDDAHVQRSAVHLATMVTTPAAVPSLTRLLTHVDPQLRTDALKALGAVGTTTALQALERMIDDANRNVRMAAYRALLQARHSAAAARLLAALRRKETRALDLSEKMALSEACGVLAGAAAIPAFDEILNARGFLGAREPTDLRACAARALGVIGTPAAVEVLKRAVEGKDVVVRTAVARALRGGV